MTTLVKALLGGAVVTVPASAIAMAAFRESIFGGSTSNNKVVTSESDSSDLKDRCYVIPTESDLGKQLLVCTDKDSSKTGRGTEEYWYGDGGENTKVKTINKKESDLEITLESGGSPVKVNLKVANESWTNFSGNTDLSDCTLVINGKTKLQCIGGESGSAEITLTKFRE